MTTTFAAASAAYGQAQKLISGGENQQANVAAKASQGPDFGQILSETVQNVVDQGKKSDQMTLDMVNGRANVVDVVTAVSETELAIESMVTVRDRVISAYEEIMRMPI